MSLNVGDVYEVDGQEYRVTDVKTEEKPDGSTVQVTTNEPV